MIKFSLVPPQTEVLDCKKDTRFIKLKVILTLVRQPQLKTQPNLVH